MTDNLKRFPEMPSCCCYGLIDGKILRWCGTQRVRFLLWQKQLRAIVRRTMSSLCRRKRFLRTVSSSCTIVDLYFKIPSFIWHIYNDYNVTHIPWIFEANASEVLKLARLVFLQSMQLEVSSVPLEGRKLLSAGREVLITPFRCRWKVNVPWRRNSNARLRFSRKKIWKMMDLLMISNLFLCLLCFFICLHGGLMWYQFTQLLSDVTLGLRPFRTCFVQAMKERALAAESYLSSLEQELQLHKEIAPQLQVANRAVNVEGKVQWFEAKVEELQMEKRRDLAVKKLDDFLQNARYIYVYMNKG